MSFQAFSNDELKVRKTVKVRGQDFEFFDAPISSRENIQRLYEGKTPLWIPFTNEMVNLKPDCDPENIARSPRACFTVVGEAGGPEEGASPRLRSAVAFGRIRILATKEENRLGLEALLRGRPRRRPADAGAMRKVHVLRFDIERLTGSGR